MISDELNNIKDRYQKRTVENSATEELFSKNIVLEREDLYKNIIHQHFSDLTTVKLIEIGAGNGYNLDLFIHSGLKKENVCANELLDDRVESFRKRNPELKIFPGNALDLKFTNEFDIVFQSTVFTSILDQEFRILLANKMWDMLKPNGIILWYDFVYDNPNNDAVKKVGIDEIKKLFPQSTSIKFTRVTLAPPIARRVGRFYSFFNLFPFLRTHVIAVIKK